MLKLHTYCKRLILFVMLMMLHFVAGEVSGLPGYLSGDKVVSIPDAVMVAQDSFKALYFKALEENTDLFVHQSYKNLIADGESINWDFASKAAAFLQLVDFLETQQSKADAQLMLAKLNELFYLLFHSYLAHLEIAKERQVQLVHSLHVLFNVKDGNGNGILRTLLMRTFIYTFRVEIMNKHYYDKKETLLFVYEDFRAAMLRVAAVHDQPADVVQHINAFMSDLAAFGIKEPIIRPSNIKRWVIGILVVVAICAVVYGVAKYFGTWQHFMKQLKEEVIEPITASFAKTLAENFSYPTADRFALVVVENLKANAEEMGMKMAAGMSFGLNKRLATEAPDTRPTIPNQDTMELGQKLGAALADGMAFKNKDTPPAEGREQNPALKVAGMEMSNGMIKGIVQATDPSVRVDHNLDPLPQNRELDALLVRLEGAVVSAASKIPALGRFLTPPEVHMAQRRLDSEDQTLRWVRNQLETPGSAPNLESLNKELLAAQSRLTQAAEALRAAEIAQQAAPGVPRQAVRAVAGAARGVADYARAWLPTFLGGTPTEPAASAAAGATDAGVDDGGVVGLADSDEE